jgi:cell division protein FtsZ
MSANPPSASQDSSAVTPDLRVIGFGGAGNRIVAELVRGGFPPSAVVALDAEEADLAANPAALRFAVQCRRLRGLGTGGDPDNGRAAVEENAEQLKATTAGAPVVLLAAGLGGGFATGAAPAAAQLWKQGGATLIGLLVLPFACEGRRRAAQAVAALQELQTVCDAVLTLPNEAVFRLVGPDASVVESFAVTNCLLADTLRGLWRLLSGGGPVALPLADLCGALHRRRAEGSFASVEAAGNRRAEQVLARLKTHPLLDGNPTFDDADIVLVSFAGGTSLAMAEVDQVMKFVSSQVPDALVKFGVTVDEGLGDRMVVTLIAAQTMEAPVPVEASPDEPTKHGTPPETDFLTGNAPRPAPRVVPPAPEFPPEKRDQIMAQHTRSGGRGRPRGKAKQNQLQFDLVSKGRFEKSEPTVHRGEDLDLPTYIRRGLPLN